MKKSIRMALLMVMLISVLFLPVAVFAASEQETALDTGDRNVAFSNGYRGFCLDVAKKGAYAGDVFSPASNTSAAISNKDNSDISRLLKVLFTQCFEDVFVSDGNGGYQINDTNLIQAVVWHFSDGQYVYGTQKTLAEKAKAYTGPAIPDSGYVRELDNGEVITFYFAVMTPQNTDQQDFFAYRIEVSQNTTHEHVWSNDWSFNETDHWHECECGEKKDADSHSGGAANCVEAPKCEICQQSYGSKDSRNHTGETELRNDKEPTETEPGYTGDTHCKACGEKLEDGREIPKLHTHEFSNDWTFNETDHWHECECGEKKDADSHSGGAANCVEAPKCEICQQTYGSKDSRNHTGETELRNDKEPTETEPGYTGDTHCKACGEKLEDGREIPKLHTHEYSDDWSFDETDHWHECECGEKKDEDSHSGGEANCVEAPKCEICQQPYGSKDPQKHTGETELRNDKEPTETEPGYTGDTHCKACGEKLEDGREIPKLHTHEYSNDWSFDETDHWHECECGEKKDEDSHSGGAANCVEAPKCKICQQTYGSKDSQKHTGETELRNDKEPTETEPGYTGDTHCKACGEKLEEGREIPKLHTHEYSDDWSFDETDHWHECECGEKKDEDSHSGGAADCVEPAKCKICQQPYGSKDPQKHTGETELRNDKEPTETEPGYTGDTHCKACGEKLEEGREIPKLHTHEYSEDWTFNETDHWHECECGEKTNPENHTYKNGSCSKCGAVDSAGTPEMPQTADDSRLGLWSALLLMSLGGLSWIVLLERKNGQS